MFFVFLKDPPPPCIRDCELFYDSNKHKMPLFNFLECHGVVIFFYDSNKHKMPLFNTLFGFHKENTVTNTGADGELFYGNDKE